MDYPKNWKDVNTGRSEVGKWIKTHYPEWYEFLINKYNLPANQAAYLFYNNLDKAPVCEACGAPVVFRGVTKGYSRFCCNRCSSLFESTKLKHNNTLIERYGEDYGRVLAKKGVQTKIERYGSASYNNLEKRKQTCIERFGVDNPLKSASIQEKARQTNLKRYGVEYSQQSKEISEKRKTTILNKVIDNHKDVISLTDGIFTCRCTDSECNLCTEKTYQASYYVYYERKYKYKRNPCTKKNPIGQINVNTQGTSIELFVRDILDEYKVEYICNDRSILHGRELDIYIPSHNLAIECNGCYWHSSNSKDDRHYNKYTKCKEKDIQLLTIWEDQIINYPEKVRSIILSKLGIYEQRIYARSCQVRGVDSKTSREFLNLYHLQGSVNSSVRLGLYYNDELISIMTFGKGRKCLNSRDSWELYRYCCKAGVQVIGGASKLFSHFIKTYNPDQVTSFSSNDISDGSLYKQLGFHQISESISYWYILGATRYHRYNFTKHKLVQEGFDSSKSESEIMRDRGYLKIYDTGQTKWMYDHIIE